MSLFNSECLSMLRFFDNGTRNRCFVVSILVPSNGVVSAFLLEAFFFRRLLTFPLVVGQKCRLRRAAYRMVILVDPTMVADIMIYSNEFSSNELLISSKVASVDSLNFKFTARVKSREMRLLE